jgi:hypothetical protein
MVLIAITVSSGWALYVGAQELQTQLAISTSPEADARLRYQFTDHFFTQRGQQFEIFLRLDKFTGQTWRYHASQPSWTLIPEADGSSPSLDRENRYELLSHVYRDQLGTEQEMFIRVDYIDGRSWRYQGMAGTWDEIKMEQPPEVESVPAAPQPEPLPQEAAVSDPAPAVG